MSADIVNLFQAPQNGSPFRQGVIVTWAGDGTGANTVNIGGQLFTNLPMITNAGTAFLAVGDVVMCMFYSNSFCIMGRVDNVGAGFARGSIGADALTVFAAPPYSISHFPTPVGICSITFTAPTWANTALITAAAVTVGKNTTASTDFLINWIAITGQPLAYQNNAQALAGAYATNSASTSFKLAISGGAALVVTYNIAAQNAAWGSDTGNESTLSASALWLSL